MKRRVRASAVCVFGDRLLCVRLRDPYTGVARLFPPGGAVEPGETPGQAAARETLEETGHAVMVDETRSVVAHYPYDWNGARYQVTTTFVAARLLDPSAEPAPVSDAAYHEGVVWLPLSRLAQELSFCEPIREAVSALIDA